MNDVDMNAGGSPAATSKSAAAIDRARAQGRAHLRTRIGARAAPGELFDDLGASSGHASDELRERLRAVERLVERDRYGLRHGASF